MNLWKLFDAIYQVSFLIYRSSCFFFYQILQPLDTKKKSSFVFSYRRADSSQKTVPFFEDTTDIHLGPTVQRIYFSNIYLDVSVVPVNFCSILASRNVAGSPRPTEDRRNQQKTTVNISFLK